MPRAKTVYCGLNCGRERDYVINGLCHTCYDRLRKQMLRGPTWMINRQKTLDVWSEGLFVALGNVKPIKHVRKRAA